MVPADGSVSLKMAVTKDDFPAPVLPIIKLKLDANFKKTD